MFKYCHSCGAEFQPFAETCPDCNEALHADPAHPQEPAAGAAAELEDLVMLKVGEPSELRELAESLQAHGISSQIDSYPLGGSIAGARARSRGEPVRLGIYVERADLDAVREFAAERAADDGGAEHDPTVCPACGEPTPENAASCSSCGLEFPEVESDAGR